MLTFRTLNSEYRVSARGLLYRNDDCIGLTTREVEFVNQPDGGQVARVYFEPIGSTVEKWLVTSLVQSITFAAH